MTASDQPLAVVLALAGSCCYALAVVTQQRAAARVPGRAFDPAVLTRLVRRPAWLAGLVLVIAGFSFQASAVGLGRLVLVEPVLASGLLFALALAAWRDRQRLRAIEWIAAIAAVAGIAIFVGVSQPAGGLRVAAVAPLAMTAGGVAALVVLCSLLLGRIPASWRALVLGVVGGTAAGANDALTKSAAVLAVHHKFGLLADPRLYLLFAVGLCAYTIQQNGYRSGGLAAFLPAFAVVEAVSGSLLGLGIYEERLGDQPFQIVVEIAAGATAVWGIIQLARSARLSPPRAGQQAVLPAAQAGERHGAQPPAADPGEPDASAPLARADGDCADSLAAGGSALAAHELVPATDDAVPVFPELQAGPAEAVG